MLPELLERLKHPDQSVRIETLRILAMVEEVRALNAIAQVYRTDPEPSVRQVAHWAGQIIYAAKRSAQTPAATTAPSLSERQEAFLRSLIEKDPRTYDLMQLSLQREELHQTRASMPPAPPSQAPLDLMRLLDEGLSEDFFS